MSILGFCLRNVSHVLFQVDKLSAEIHEWKKKSKDKVDNETQTEEYVWTEAGVQTWLMSDNRFS